MRMSRIFGVAAMTAALAGAAYAYPTFTGPTGLANLPTAGTVPAAATTVAADFYNTENDINGNTFPIRITHGFTPNLEANAALLLQDNNQGWGVGAKYRTPLTVGDFAWSLGGQFLQATDVDTNIVQVYFVGTRGFNIGTPTTALTGTVGVNWTNFDNTASDFSDSSLRLFLGGELTFNNTFTLGAELQTEDTDIEDQALTSVYVRYPITGRLRAQAGWSNGVFGVTGSRDHNFFIGASVPLGR